MKTSEAERFYGIHARFYDVTRRLILPQRKRAVRMLDIGVGDRVIDFACGTGLNFGEILKYGPGEVIGVDASEAMLAKARKKFPSVTIRKADLLTFECGEKADRAISSYALTVMDDWEGALEVMRRSLKPGGTLVILDFIPFQGRYRSLNVVFRQWFSRFGVVERKPIGEVLGQLFGDVTCRVPRFGYSAVWVAKRPLEFRH
jgi:ubiquinone/menaquinone biosynthesis C-methylase UbiE